ncbi:hypothetical protein EGI16_21325 [Chryseobacterium sp. G0240]|uniref:hypothetical protein n=1 Tax=Chryseobacterium sp. G0240 TaxID=2487066 RepID=UPI000F45E38D|nr:hypothetical protein [Chryseobacterium sp. G0240]ROH98379.1 hypothetical protein EGI16_21325 [Chryseobacterium sp. G0240]
MRTKTLKNVLDKKIERLKLYGVWLEAFGNPGRKGKVWLFYGEEKNGKTWFSILFADYLAKSEPILYVSAEEGLEESFQDVLMRANVDTENKKFKVIGRGVSLQELDEYLSTRYAPKIVFIDNITVYVEELKNGGLQKLLKNHPEKLFIFIAHEERGEPYTATAKMVKRLADRIVRIQGLVATVGGRTDGGKFIIDQEKAMVLFGSDIKD